MNWARRVGAALGANPNACLFVLGLGLAVHGVARWSPTAAYVAAGSTLMLVAVWPFLRPTRKP